MLTRYETAWASAAFAHFQDFGMQQSRLPIAKRQCEIDGCMAASGRIIRIRSALGQHHFCKVPASRGREEHPYEPAFFLLHFEMGGCCWMERSVFDFFMTLTELIHVLVDKFPAQYTSSGGKPRTFNRFPKFTNASFAVSSKISFFRGSYTFALKESSVTPPCHLVNGLPLMKFLPNQIAQCARSHHLKSIFDSRYILHSRRCKHLLASIKLVAAVFSFSNSILFWDAGFASSIFAKAAAPLYNSSFNHSSFVGRRGEGSVIFGGKRGLTIFSKSSRTFGGQCSLSSGGQVTSRHSLLYLSSFASSLIFRGQMCGCIGTSQWSLRYWPPLMVWLRGRFVLVTVGNSFIGYKSAKCLE
ncbi:hypothetical protein N431DRAFT_522319 [Stipitochalara longipes BDJ]|nr:hypothetical protein N431DRAFT_522319 [Stipitochalara longipes BDJ]